MLPAAQGSSPFRTADACLECALPGFYPDMRARRNSSDAEGRTQATNYCVLFHMRMRDDGKTKEKMSWLDL